MPTFLMVKKSSKASGKREAGTDARVGKDGGIKNSRFTTKSPGTVATGTYGQVNARVAANHAANGTNASFSKGQHVSSGGIMASGGQTKGSVPAGSAFNKANVRVAAKGPTPKPSGIDVGPQTFSGKNKNLTKGGAPVQAGFGGQAVGYSGSSNGRSGLGQTGSGVGKKKKFSKG